MALPSIEQYISVIRKMDPTTLSTLLYFDFNIEAEQGAEFVMNTGTSAVAVKAKNEGRNYAIRFFLRGDEDTFRRYQVLATFLANKDFSWRVPFQFLKNEVLIDGLFYPIVKMDWVEGTPLNDFIESNAGDKQVLLNLQQKLAALSGTLEDAGVGHGDLKYNNIFIGKDDYDFNVKLIDYDSMFIPAFAGKKSLEIGSPGFQPLKRLSSHFFKEIDRFSIWVLLATIEAVSTDATIWKQVGKGGFNNDDSLFSATDFFNPSESSIFQKLEGYNNPVLNFYLQTIIDHCKTSDFKAIPKPEVQKRQAGVIAPTQAPLYVQPLGKPEPEPLFAIEIKTVPAGKDVLVEGEKRGVTPMQLKVSKKELRQIVVVNEGLITPVRATEDKGLYEFDFTKKKSQPVPVPDEIIEFSAHKYSVDEDSLATIKWKVSGSSKIHISNIGYVDEKIGSNQMVLKNTTNYVLTVGEKTRQFTIHVQPKPKPKTKPEPAEKTETFLPKTNTIFSTLPPVVTQKKPAATAMPVKPKRIATKEQKKRFSVKGVSIFVIVAALSFFGFRYLSVNKTQQQTGAATTPPVANTNAAAVTFTDAGVRSFLTGLYQAYNSRKISAIMPHYAGLVTNYYDATAVTRDSLATLINDLFITPALYSCTPDFATMTITPQAESCKIAITIRERLKSNNGSRTENFTTKIEYQLDASYKIISEKTPG